MANYYGVKPELIRAVIGAKRSTDDSTALMLESESPQNHPAAYFQFRLKCFNAETVSKDSKSQADEEPKDVNL